MIWQSRIYVFQVSDQGILQQDEKRHPGTEGSYAYDNKTLSEQSDIEMLVLWENMHLTAIYLSTSFGNGPSWCNSSGTDNIPSFSCLQRWLVKDHHFPGHTHWIRAGSTKPAWLFRVLLWNWYGNLLEKNGLSPSDTENYMDNRSLEMVMAIFGILKTMPENKVIKQESKAKREVTYLI